MSRTVNATPASSPFYTAEHAAFRDAMRRFVAREITPNVEAWEAAASFPLELYRKAAEIGLLGLGFPEAYGGNDGDLFMTIIAAQELARCGAGGVLASLLSHTIGCPPIVNVASEEIKRKVLPAVLRGEKISALGITEPSGGSDVANRQPWLGGEDLGDLWREGRGGDDDVRRRAVGDHLAVCHHDDAIRKAADGADDFFLVLVRFLKDGVERGDDRHAQVLQQADDIVSRLAAIDAELVLEADGIDAVHVEEVDGGAIVGDHPLADLELHLGRVIVAARDVVDCH